MTVRMGDAAVYLGADQTGLDRDLDRAQQSTQGWLGRISDGIGIAIGGAVVSAVGKLAQGIAAVGGQVLQMSGDIDVATGQLQTRLGLTNEQALIFGDTIRQVYGDNFGESIDDVGQQVAIVGQQLAALDQLTEENLGKTTEYAIALRDAFEADVGKSINAAGVLVDQFGLSWDDAFSLITSGMQRGLNSSGDFLESITEYGVQFSEGGATAAEFFSVMESGLQAGMLGTDKAADLFKEFRVRIQDGSTMTADGLRMIGLSADEMNEKMANGSLSAIDAFSLIQEQLALVEDENVRFQAGVALMGTQYEDLGQSVVAGIDPALRGMEELSGATDSLNRQYENLPTMLEGLKRRFVLTLEPIGAKLLEIGQRIMPHVERAFAALEEKVVPIIEAIAGGIGTFLDVLLQTGDPLEALRAVFGAEAVAGVEAFVNGLAGIWNWLTNLLQPIADAVLQFVSFKDVLTAIGIVLAVTILPILASFAAGVIAAAAPVILIVGGIALAVAGLRAAWESNFLGIRDILTDVWENKLAPVFEAVRAWLAEKIPIAIAAMKDWWENTLLPALSKVWTFIQNNIIPIFETVGVWLAENIPVAIEAARAAWEDVILPAIQTVWQFVDGSLLPLLRDVAEVVGTVLGLAVTALAGIWENVLVPALEKVWKWFDEKILPVLTTIWEFISNNLGPVLDSFKRNTVDALTGALGWLAEQIAKVRDFLQELKAGLDSITLPDWMTPGSPTPWEMGLRGVAEALRQVSDVEIPNLASRLDMTASINGAAAAASGGGNHYYSNLTIYTNAPYEPIADDFRMMYQNWRQQP